MTITLPTLLSRLIYAFSSKCPTCGKTMQTYGFYDEKRKCKGCPEIYGITKEAREEIKKRS